MYLLSSLHLNGPNSTELTRGGDSCFPESLLKSNNQTDEPPALYCTAANFVPSGDQIGKPILASGGSLMVLDSFVLGQYLRLKVTSLLNVISF